MLLVGVALRVSAVLVLRRAPRLRLSRAPAVRGVRRAACLAPALRPQLLDLQSAALLRAGRADAARPIRGADHRLDLDRQQLRADDPAPGGRRDVPARVAPRARAGPGDARGPASGGARRRVRLEHGAVRHVQHGGGRAVAAGLPSPRAQRGPLRDRRRRLPGAGAGDQGVGVDDPDRAFCSPSARPSPAAACARGRAICCAPRRPCWR